MSSNQSLSVAPPVGRLALRDQTIKGGPFVVAAVAFVAVIATHLINFGADDLRIRVLDANSSSSWSHVLVAATLVGATAIASFGAFRARRHRLAWGATAAILAFLAIDEISSLHAQIDRMSWGKALYAPVLLALCVSAWSVSDWSAAWSVSDWSERGIVVRVGLALLVISFGIHVFGPHVLQALGWGSDSWAYQTKVALKQGTELAGWLLVLIGLWRLVVPGALASRA